MNRLLLLLVGLPLLALSGPLGCATKPGSGKATRPGATRTVRTTAYTAYEPGGPRNALGQRLSAGVVTSAAADWSQFPVGTKFKVRQDGRIYRIDDYGSALVGTETIDLYRTSGRDMRNWGVRHVEIEILEWGCPQKSLEILAPRSGRGYVRQMVNRLRTQAKTG